MEQTTQTEAAPVVAAKPVVKGGAVDALFAKPDPKLGAAPEAIPPKVEAAPDSAAKQLALIARENKRLAAEREAFEQERGKFKERLTTAEKLEALQKQIKENPLKVLKEFGMDYAQLVQAELARQEEEANPTMRKVRELEHRLSEKEKAEAEANVRYKQQQQQLLVDKHVSDIRTHIAGNADKYEFLSTYKAEQDVFARIKEVFDKSVKYDAQGRIEAFKELTIEEACDQLEAEYEESATALTKLKKIQAKVSPKPETKAAPKTKPAAVEDKLAPVSLNNSLNGSGKPAPLTKAERRDRAFAALHGQQG